MNAEAPEAHAASRAARDANAVTTMTGIWGVRARGPDDVEPVAIGQAQVRDHEGRRRRFDGLEPFDLRSGRHHPVALAAKQAVIGDREVWLVFDDQDGVHAGSRTPGRLALRAKARSMSVSVTIPTRSEPSSTGRAPILCSSISRAASAAS